MQFCQLIKIPWFDNSNFEPGFQNNGFDFYLSGNLALTNAARSPLQRARPRPQASAAQATATALLPP